jgi:hypothetical protein
MRKPADEQAEWVCWDHWKRIPLPERRVYTRAYYDAEPRDELKLKRRPRYLASRRTRILILSEGRPAEYARAERLWERMKRRAVECADLGSFA